MRVPPLSMFPGSTYRFSAIATATDAASYVVLRKQATPTLSVGTWLAPPTAVSASRSAATWSGNTGSNVQTVRYQTDDTNQIAELMIFDGRSTIEVPASITMPNSALRVVVTTIDGSIDVANFAFADHRDWVKAAGIRSVPLP
jgi:hypothetical protein